MTSINETKLLNQSENIYSITNLLLLLYGLSRTIIKQLGGGGSGLGRGVRSELHFVTNLLTD